ncbi:MAG: LysR family transcriptional regulator [Pseudomonadota bacterium]
MDIDLARTYLAVMTHGSFKHAASELHCTQSTVTARIKQLEQLLGRALFVRSRAGAAPTPEGRRFRPYADRLLLAWREAQQALGLPSRLKGTVRVELDRRLAPQVGLAVSAGLLNALPDWSVEVLEAPQTDADLAIGYGMTPLPGRAPLARVADELVLVATSARTAVDWDPDYRAIDWGHPFREAYARHYPVDRVPQLQLPAERWSLDCLIAVGGSAYVPLSWCTEALASHTLHRVTNAATFPIDLNAVERTPDAAWAQPAGEAIRAALGA